MSTGPQNLPPPGPAPAAFGTTPPGWGQPQPAVQQAPPPFVQQAPPQFVQQPPQQPPLHASPPVQQTLPIMAPTQPAGPIPTAAPAVPPPLAPVAVIPGATVATLLKGFAKQPGCEAYAGDSNKIKLIMTFLWLRQLTPSLPFEKFLELFAPLADYDETNRKHPEDALGHHCPRAAKVAAARNVPQWSAKECVEFSSLYIDMVREAEATQQPVPMTFDQFLGALSSQFKAGAFNVPEPAAPAAPAGVTKRKSAAAAPTHVAIRPSAAGQRVIYTIPETNGRQLRGVAEAVYQEGPNTFLTFKSDEGEVIEGIHADNCHVCDDPLPASPPVEFATGKPTTTGGEKQLLIPKSQYGSVKAALALTTAMGNVALGDAIYPYAVTFDNGYDAVIEVVNGENGPFVDARLLDPKQDDRIVYDLPPRKNIDGLYHFVDGDKTYTVEVRGRE